MVAFAPMTGGGGWHWPTMCPVFVAGQRACLGFPTACCSGLLTTKCGVPSVVQLGSLSLAWGAVEWCSIGTSSACPCV